MPSSCGPRGSLERAVWGQRPGNRTQPVPRGCTSNRWPLSPSSRRPKGHPHERAYRSGMVGRRVPAARRSAMKIAHPEADTERQSGADGSLFQRPRQAHAGEPIRVPLLGAELGGLPQDAVRAAMTAALGDLPHVTGILPPPARAASPPPEPWVAAIRSRAVPPDALAWCTRVGAALARRGYTLVTGGAPGADHAFARGVAAAAPCPGRVDPRAGPRPPGPARPRLARRAVWRHPAHDGLWGPPRDPRRRPERSRRADPPAARCRAPSVIPSHRAAGVRRAGQSA